MRLFFVGFLLFSAVAQAENLVLDIEIPRHQVAEYHKPYVSAWIEDDGTQVIAPLLLWYGVNMPKEEGKEWLKDLRLWWRRIGRNAELPIDGATGATRGPGLYSLSFIVGKVPLETLPNGEYSVVVEAVREVGGREMLKLPFSWPANQVENVQVKGQHELGEVTLKFKP